MNTDHAWKLSYYNLIIDDFNDVVCIWNTKRGSVVQLDKDTYSCFEKNFFDSIPSSDLASYIKEGLLVPQDLDEQQEILFTARQRQYSLGQTSLGFVIAPTVACNFRCPYCFEQGIDRCGYMSKETQRLFIDFLEKLLHNDANIKNVRITWFGGEPLLAYDSVIVPLQSKIIALCHKMNVTVAFSIITNGYFLTSEKLDFLFKIGQTKFVQLTLDGSGEEYAKRKSTSIDAFYRVVDNLLNLSDYLHKNTIDAKIKVRLNVDNDNYEDVKNLALSLKSDSRFCDNIDFSLERLRKYGHCQELQSFCTTEEFEHLKYDFNSFLEKSFKFPEPKTVFCGQHCMNVFCVGINGELYKCEHDIGIQKHAVGNIRNGLTYNKYFLDFMDLPLPKKCLNCKILPVCMGGCPHRRLMNNNNTECDFTINNLIKVVKHFISEKEVN